MNEVVQTNTQPAIMEAKEIGRRIGQIQEIMTGVMKKDTHYGVIPGCGDKPTLLQPGAQVLGVAFGLYAEPVDERIEPLENGHIECFIKLAIKRIDNDKIISYGMGVCSTMEKQYRFRKGQANVTPLDDPIPNDYKANKAAYAKKGFGCRKIDGGWRWCKLEHSEVVEHDNPADYHNTARKIAFKRGYVHGIINATACSDIFTQDVEDMRGLINKESEFEVSSPPYKEAENKKNASKPHEDTPQAAPKEKEGSEPTPEQNAAVETAKKAVRGEENSTEKEIPAGVDPMTDDLFADVAKAFENLHRDLDEDYLERLIPNPQMKDRDRFLKAYKLINKGVVEIDQALAADDIDDLFSMAK